MQYQIGPQNLSHTYIHVLWYALYYNKLIGKPKNTARNIVKNDQMGSVSKKQEPKQNNIVIIQYTYLEQLGKSGTIVIFIE
jgi:hypothetical protein